MSREQLSALEQDVQRLLLTGPSLASGDEGLTARRKWLEAAGARVPAFAKLAEQVGRVQGSTPEQQRGELLSLTTALAQVRAAQAQPRESQTAGPVPATEPVDTPLPPAVVEQTRRYLLELVNPRTGKPPTAQERLAGVREAIEHKSLRDLRLLVPAVRAVTEADALGKDLVEKGLPLFGAAAGPLLRARLKLEGNALDGLLLRGVALTEGAAALPLVREAVSKAAGPVRASGLRELVRLAPEEGIPLAKDMLTATPPPKPEPKKKPKAKKVAAKKGKAEPKGKKKPARKWTHAKEVREAAALALGASAQADTVKLLAQVAGDQEDPVAKAAVEGLAQCPSTEAFAALESLCRRHALRMKNFQYKYLRRKKGAKVTKEARVAWQKAQAERRRAWDHQRSYVEALVDAMGESVDPRGRALVHELAIKPRLAWSVLHRARQFLHKDRSPEARAFLLAGLDSSNQGYRALATQQVVHHWPEVARAELAPRFTEASVKKAATRSLLRQVLWALRSQSSASNPAWREVLRLGMKHADTMPPAVQAAQHLGAGHFFEELCGILERSRSWVTNSAFSMLCAHKDWRATPAMLKYLGRARYVGWIQGFCDTVRSYGDPELLPALYKRLGKARAKHDKAKLKDLIKEFEAKAEAAAKKAGTTVPAAKKTAAKKSTAKKPAAKKAAVKKTVAKKTPKKTATKKVAAKKTAVKKTAPKKGAVRKAAKSA